MYDRGRRRVASTISAIEAAGRNPAQQAKIAAIIEKAARANVSLLCPQNVLTEFEYVMLRVYGIDPKRIAAMISREAAG